MIPEMARESKEEQDFKIEIEKHTNAIEAAAVGATRGMQLAINVGAIVLAFVGLIALTNSLLEGLGNQFNIDNFSLEIILGYLFKPVAFMLGIPLERSTASRKSYWPKNWYSTSFSLTLLLQKK